ncbi:metallophosphoesterase family protein, partial [Candidatus Bathyarchaeota archaeon]|nr:metallophosphoesterase family protein [Candidatus Bathyarchaeota archaeon]
AMLIAQISDIHFGPMLNRESFKIAVKEINEMNPDAVLVTGDLAENGNISEFRAASNALKKLKTRKIVYVSGNHDYRSTRLFAF